MLTFVGRQDDKQVAAAIHRELLRDGQVFYLHNRVESIDKAARKIRELVPEARVAVAHGQMGEDALEKIMVGFWEKEYDVLVCTTIVESGIDIPNANTLIVERADLLGLAQLHQIRGRVGRGRERAYAYFLYPAGEAADRARPRAAGDHRPAHRARRRHVRGDEGPGDPRRRQPARRRAVRAHRGRRLRPLRADGRRGGGQLQGRAARRRSPTSRSTCRSTPTCRTTTSASSGCAWRCTASSPTSATRPTLDEVVAEMTDRYGAPPEPVREPDRGRAVPAAGPGVRPARRVAAGQARAVRPDAAAGLQAAAAQAVLPGVGLQAGHRPGVAAPADHPPGRRRAAARCRDARLVR